MIQPFQTIHLPDEMATNRLGEDLAVALRAGDCVLLRGDLGMGKTTLARAVIRAFLGDPEAEVPSPTFTLANLYESGRMPLTHFDLYRLSDPDELEEIGFFEALDSGITLVEWPDRASDDMPAGALVVEFAIDGAGRTVSLFQLGADAGPWPKRMARSLTGRKFLNENGWHDARRTFLQGDASPRAYEKVASESQGNAILMDAPAVEDGPIVKNGKRYSQIAHIAEDVRPFWAIGEALRNRGLPAPEMHAFDLDQGFLLVEDFGQETVIKDGVPDPERYDVAVDILAFMHGMDWPAAVPLPDGTQYTIPPLDRGVLEIEISLLKDWYAPHVLSAEISEAAHVDYLVIWEDLFKQLDKAEQGWLLRDYHSPNLMWREGETGLNRIGMIDYQDTLLGPTAYDVASLCQDARITVPPTMEQGLIERYCQARKAQDKSFDEAGFHEAYAIIAAERGTRLLGLWPRLKYRDGKPNYMRHMDRTKDYLTRVLSNPTLAPLRDWYQTHLPLY